MSARETFKKVCCALFSFAIALTVQSADRSLLGKQAPEWAVTEWIHSTPLHLEDLRGKVVLIRWWTAPACPYCKASAPALRHLDKEYKSAGLQVIGLYHHKASDPLKVDSVKKYAEDLGFEFPVGIDANWTTLNLWWLNRGEAKFTSVSFLLDKKGVVRHIHPGGELVQGTKDYEQLRRKIEALLAER